MRLFAPATGKTLTLTNRMIMPAMQLKPGPDNLRTRPFYPERARGGAGARV